MSPAQNIQSIAANTTPSLRDLEFSTIPETDSISFPDQTRKSSSGSVKTYSIESVKAFSTDPVKFDSRSRSNTNLSTTSSAASIGASSASSDNTNGNSYTNGSKMSNFKKFFGKPTKHESINDDFLTIVGDVDDTIIRDSMINSTTSGDSSVRSSFNNSVLTNNSSIEDYSMEESKNSCFSIEKEDLNDIWDNEDLTDDDEENSDVLYHQFLEKCSNKSLKSKRSMFSFRKPTYTQLLPPEVEPESKGSKSIMFSKIQQNEDRDSRLKKIKSVPSLRINTPSMGYTKSDIRMYSPTYQTTFRYSGRLMPSSGSGGSA